MGSGLTPCGHNPFQGQAMTSRNAKAPT
jgi:hypothetical protein